MSNHRPLAQTTVALLIALTISLFVLAQSPARRRVVAKEPAAPIATPSATPQSAPRNQQASLLPLRRAILYSNGVAYFERRGMVSGRAEINLSFKQSQVDDVLKSLVVLDLGKGRVLFSLTRTF